MKLAIEINQENLENLINICSGLFYPLRGFMCSRDCHRVIDSMTLSDGSIWTIPITLDVGHDLFIKAVDSDRLYLQFQGDEVAYMKIEDCYRIDPSDILKIYGTQDPNHPGIKKEAIRSVYRVGGEVVLLNRHLLSTFIDPEKTREVFQKKGWRTVVGFQTRNPIHKAHEYIHRACLEQCDALFINPVVGWKRPDDFSEEAIKVSYSAMIENYYPKNRVHFEFLKMPTRYAGPRDAIFHAIIRKNLGCTHFVIGRDHGGVGAFYTPYQAHELAIALQKKQGLGIELLLFKEPYHCTKCGFVVTEKHCACGEKYKISISGTKIRTMLKEDKRPDEIFMRQDIADAILALGDRMFVS